MVFKLTLSHWVLFPCEEHLRAWDRVRDEPKVMGEVHAKGKNSLFEPLYTVTDEYHRDHVPVTSSQVCPEVQSRGSAWW